MKRLLLLTSVALAALVAVLGYRTFRFEPRRVEVPPMAEFDPLPGSTERLAAALRIPTISHGDSALRDSTGFIALRNHLAVSFPRTHATMSREIVGDAALLLPGLDPTQ